MFFFLKLSHLYAPAQLIQTCLLFQTMSMLTGFKCTSNKLVSKRSFKCCFEKTELTISKVTCIVLLISPANPPVKGASCAIKSRPVFRTDLNKQNQRVSCR